MAPGRAGVRAGCVPHVGRRQAGEVLRRGGAGVDAQRAVGARALPVVRVVLHHVVRLHAVVEHRHQQLERDAPRGNVSLRERTRRWTQRIGTKEIRFVIEIIFTQTIKR